MGDAYRLSLSPSVDVIDSLGENSCNLTDYTLITEDSQISEQTQIFKDSKFLKIFLISKDSLVSENNFLV